MTPTVSICIATYRRNDRLRDLLEDLRQQDHPPDQIVVVDNDADGGARAVVDAFRGRGCPFPVDYDVQPHPNIALTRNRTVELATGHWLAFVDDDERAPREWLGRLVQAADEYGADGVLAPVEPRVPPEAPRWLRRGKFYDFPHQRSGAPVPLNCMRFGNVLLSAHRVREQPGPFDPAFGLTAGEDGDLLVRMANQGSRIVWYEGAPVFEPIEAKRLSLRWLLQRAFGGGQGYGRAVLGGHYRPISVLARLLFYARACAQMLVALALAGLSWPMGRHHGARWLIKSAANAGKLSTLWGSRHSEYARPPGATRGTEARPGAPPGGDTLSSSSSRNC